MDTSARSKPVECVIVGAGLAGLMAGARLQQSAVEVTIIERLAQAGGRIQTWVMESSKGQAAFDTGAQFFTVREPQFEKIVHDWLKRGLATVWSHGFATADGSYYRDGHPRYRGVPNMAAITHDLAKDLDIRTQHSVRAISFQDGSWQINFTDRSSISALSLILTPPVPTMLELLGRGGFTLPQSQAMRLARLRYTPCLALLLLLEGPGKVPEPGGMWPLGPPVDWIADNYQKGVSRVPGAITVHAGPEFSQEYWHAEEALVTDRLLEHVSPWMADSVLNTKLIRWKFSKPDWLYPERCLVYTEPARLILAGDAFAGPRVEGAALSGLAAAEWLLNH